MLGSWMLEREVREPNLRASCCCCGVGQWPGHHGTRAPGLRDMAHSVLQMFTRDQATCISIFPLLRILHLSKRCSKQREPTRTTQVPGHDSPRAPGRPGAASCCSAWPSLPRYDLRPTPYALRATRYGSASGSGSGVAGSGIRIRNRNRTRSARGAARGARIRGPSLACRNASCCSAVVCSDPISSSMLLQNNRNTHHPDTPSGPAGPTRPCTEYHRSNKGAPLVMNVPPGSPATLCAECPLLRYIDSAG